MDRRSKILEELESCSTTSVTFCTKLGLFSPSPKESLYLFQIPPRAQPLPPFQVDPGNINRMSILRSKNNSPLTVAEELNQHLPVVVHSSFMSLRSSFMDSPTEKMKHHLAMMLEKGADVISDDNELGAIIEEEGEEDSLSEDLKLSKGVQKDWNLNEEVYERAVQTGVVHALDDIVEAASQSSESWEK